MKVKLCRKIDSFFHNASNIYMCCSFPVGPLHQKIILQSMRREQKKKNISCYHGSGLSHLLDRSSTVSVQTKLCEIINLRIHIFTLHWDKKGKRLSSHVEQLLPMVSLWHYHVRSCEQLSFKTAVYCKVVCAYAMRVFFLITRR